MTNAIRGAASNFFLFFDIFVASTMNRIVAFAGFSQIADKMVFVPCLNGVE